MVSHKKPRQKGKFSFSNFFQAFKSGDSVAVVRNLTFPFFYKTQIQGRTGRIVAKRGSQYEVEVKDLNKPKRYMLHPIHLKKIQETK